jgi:RP/EB family microtubule-associated protein
MGGGATVRCEEHAQKTAQTKLYIVVRFDLSIVSTMSNIGMMEGAFFVGRKEIMDWLNSTLDLNLQKVEDTANGAVACQLLDIMYPGAVPMSKVNWSAKQSFEFVANYKILQTCFTKLNIERHIDVDRLITGKYMDNLEFMQWFKRFYEMSVSDKGDYDAYAQRCKGKGTDCVLRSSCHV